MANGSPPIVVPMPWQAPIGVVTMLIALYGFIVAASFKFGDTTLQNLVCGAAIPLVGQGVQWLFGSSRGSEKKDETIARGSDKKDETIATNAAALATSTPPRPNP